MLLIGTEEPLHFTHYLFHPSPAVITEFGYAGRHIFGQEAEILHGFKYTAFGQIVVGETGFRTTEAWMVGPGFAGSTVPQDAVTTGPGHGATATYFIKETTATFTKAAVHFLGKADGIRATRLHKVGKKGFGAMEIVDQYIADTACGNRYQYLRNPVGVGRTAGDVDNGQPAF